tara:strand:- start:277 stop:564 length:288 start_codon:yes stop_codon:yes gene_type:complete
MSDEKMGEVKRVKAALETRGWRWHGANGTASGKRDLLLAPSRAGWAAGAYETAIHSWETLPKAIEATERELRQMAAEMLARADELADVRREASNE